MSDIKFREPIPHEPHESWLRDVVREIADGLDAKYEARIAALEKRLEDSKSFIDVFDEGLVQAVAEDKRGREQA